MDNYQLKTAVGFIIFNRPDNTAKVFEAIRKAQPPILLVAADGARPEKVGEAENCAATRAIIDRVDWKCEVITNYSDVNLGMKIREASAFDWIFENVEEAIILEDDCLPHPSFFRYCEELLDYYRHDSRIMTISGDNSPLGYRRTDDSYYFSIYPRTWGWATWRRAWQNYDIQMKKWPQVRDNNWLKDILHDDYSVKVWTEIFQSTYEGKPGFDTWDYQWTLASWMANGLSIIPNGNLISNLGFNQDATNTKDIYSLRSNLPTTAMQFPLKHPAFMIQDTQADVFSQKNVYNPHSFLTRVKNKIKKIFL